MGCFVASAAPNSPVLPPHTLCCLAALLFASACFLHASCFLHGCRFIAVLLCFCASCRCFGALCHRFGAIAYTCTFSFKNIVRTFADACTQHTIYYTNQILSVNYTFFMYLIVKFCETLPIWNGHNWRFVALYNVSSPKAGDETSIYSLAHRQTFLYTSGILPHLIIPLWIMTGRTNLGCIGSDYNMPAVSALPHLYGAFFKHRMCLHIPQ